MTLETRQSSTKSTKSKMTKKSSRKSTRSRKTLKISAINKPFETAEEFQKYIFDLTPEKKAVRPRRPSPTKKPANKLSVQDKRDSWDEKERQSRIAEVCKTLALLLALKIDPNASQVPQPAIVLAIFSGDVELVRLLLEAGADPNARTLPEEGWLTSLHILCLAKPQPSFPEIMDILLEYGADPNARAAIDFSPENRDFVLNGRPQEDFVAVGLTPLQALLLRSDSTFVPGKEILKELLFKLHDITMKEPNYYGHSFLSLAMIRMNLAYMFVLLHIFSEDANENLDTHWGNIATAYLIYLGKMKEPEAIIILIELEQAGMNPLRIVDMGRPTAEEENAINVGLRIMKETPPAPPSREKPHSADGPKFNKRTSTGKKKSGAAMSHSSGGSRSSKGKAPKSKINKELLKKVTLFQDLGRDKVDKYVRGVVVRRLIKHIRQVTLLNREKHFKGQEVDEADYPMTQAVNWFPTQDEFVQVLMHNVLAGHTFVCKEDVETAYNMMPWENPKPPNVLPMKKLSINRESLGQRDKVLLRQLKEAIRNQLEAGMAPENLIFSKKKGHKSSKTTRSKSKGSSKGTKKDLDNSSTIVVNDTNNEDQQLEGKATITEELKHEQNVTTFLEKFDPLWVMCAPQVRWAKRYGTRFLHRPKHQTYRTDFFPEVDKNPFLYRVCYKCVKRNAALQLCPMCRLVWYCSSRCNTRDIMNPHSNHRCKADFYGRGSMWRQYGFDEYGNLMRLPRKGKGHVDWEAEDILNDQLLKKHGRKSMSPEGRSSRGSVKHSRGGRDTDARDSHGTKRRRDERRGSRRRERGKGGAAGGSILSKRRGRGGPGRGSTFSERGRRGRGRGQDSYDDRGKPSYGAGGKKSKVRPDGKKYRIGPDGKVIDGVGGTKGANAQSKLKAMLREKRDLKMKEARRLRELRKKLPKGVMGDFMKWGMMKMQDLKEQPWYQKRQSEGVLGTAFDGPLRTASQQDAYSSLRSQLKVVEELARLLGSKMDLHNLFPWVVLRDGELYYKFNATQFVLENYSFN